MKQEFRIEREWLIYEQMMLEKDHSKGSNQTELNEIKRRLWIIKGYSKHKFSLGKLLSIYFDQRKLDAVPKDYLYAKLILKESQLLL